LVPYTLGDYNENTEATATRSTSMTFTDPQKRSQKDLAAQLISIHC